MSDKLKYCFSRGVRWNNVIIVEVVVYDIVCSPGTDIRDAVYAANAMQFL